MRTASFFLAACSFVVLLLAVGAGTTIEITSVDGLLNPLLRIGMRPGKQVWLIGSTLAWFFCIYLWLVVVWVERTITSKAFHVLIRPEPAPADHQPIEIKRLKQAIREANPVAVEALLKGGVRLPVEDDSYFSPLELAELYGHSAIIALLKTERPKH